jgi:hypothetical protein
MKVTGSTALPVPEHGTVMPVIPRMDASPENSACVFLSRCHRPRIRSSAFCGTAGKRFAASRERTRQLRRKHLTTAAKEPDNCGERA